MNPRNQYQVMQWFFMDDTKKWESSRSPYRKFSSGSLNRVLSDLTGAEKNQHHTVTNYTRQFSTNGKNAVVTQEYMPDLWSTGNRDFTGIRTVVLTLEASEPKRIVISKKLKQTIMKMFDKYTGHLSMNLIPYEILLTHKEMKNQFGDYELKSRRGKYLGMKFWNGVVWINTELHIEKYGNDKKILKKKLQDTVVHELVHRKFPSMHHKSAKGKRAFHKRVNQIKRGIRYD